MREVPGAPSGAGEEGMICITKSNFGKYVNMISSRWQASSPDRARGAGRGEEPAPRRFGRARGRRGGALVELAAVMPVFITIILGMLDCSRLGMVSQLLATAAREGCRVAVINGSTQTDVQNRVNAFLSDSGISVGTVTPTPANWNSASLQAGTPIKVTLSVPFNKVSWLGTPYLFKTATLTASATMSCERY
jgi:Flp pilus assembly protein TadG